MTNAEKIALGVAGVAIVGVGLYFLTHKPAPATVSTATASTTAPKTGGGSPSLGVSIVQGLASIASTAVSGYFGNNKNAGGNAQGD